MIRARAWAGLAEVFALAAFAADLGGRYAHSLAGVAFPLGMLAVGCVAVSIAALSAG